MSWLTPEILSTFPRPAPEGNSPLANEAHRAAIEEQVEALPASVRNEVLAALSEDDRRLWGQVALAALALARTAELTPTAILAPGVIGIEDPLGRGLGLVPMVRAALPHPAGAPEDMSRLVAALDATFGAREYVLYLRRPIPPGVELGPVTRAVHLWLAAIQRGEWQGQHAIYEDESVALELTVTGAIRSERRSGLLFTVGPINALEQLSELDHRVMERLGAFDSSLGELPLVVALGSDHRWRLPRGYLQQLLLGTPDGIRTHGDVEPTYEASFRQNGRSMFADPAARTLCAIWWIGPPEPGKAGDRSFVASSWDNPWANRVAPAVDCPRFRVISSTAADGTRRSVMAWAGRSGGEAA